MADDEKKDANQPVTYSGKPPLTQPQIMHIVKMSVIAMVFFFALNYFALGQSIQTALMWSTLMGAFACTMAFGQVRRGRK